jgi:hypothetical protein
VTTQEKLKAGIKSKGKEAFHKSIIEWTESINSPSEETDRAGYGSSEGLSVSSDPSMAKFYGTKRRLR